MIPVRHMLFNALEEPFLSPEWFAEIKWDGYRIQADITPSSVRIWTRTGREITDKHPELQELRRLGKARLLVDGELCVLDERGYPRFERMRSRAYAHTIVAFDLIGHNGRDLFREPIEDRKARLEDAVARGATALMLSKMTDDPVELFRFCHEKRLEGLVMKKRGSFYYPGRRTKDWVKILTAHGKAVIDQRMLHVRRR